MLWAPIRISEAILKSTNNICFFFNENEAILMSTQNVCFYGELAKIILESFLSGPLTCMYLPQTRTYI